jgi:tRNA G18 (ribose-2'-O)-methylase SpoU
MAEPPSSAPPAANRDPDDATPDLAVGVGPHPRPWPDDARFDPHLLEHGDRRNVADRYRYWSIEAIVADLDTRRHDFAVAIENWQHDANIGTVVRTANAFLANEVLIIGRKRWNRRGAMVTDRYQHLRHLALLDDLVGYAAASGYTIVGIDNTPGSVPIESAMLPRRSLFLFGQEGPGLTDEAHTVAELTLSIAQYGSTRSINAGVAAGIAMHAWIRQHAPPPQILGATSC